MFKNFLCALFLLTAAQLPALEVGRDGESFEKDGITWHNVKYIDKGHNLHAALPGNPTFTASSTGNLISSECEGAKYEVQVYTMGVPNTPAALIAYAQLTPGTKAWEVRKPKNSKCSFMIGYERKEKGKKIAAGQVFVTKSGAYNFLVVGDLTHLAEVIKSVKIK